MASNPVKKTTPHPVPHARDAGFASRRVSPVQRFAIPAGLAVGLTLTAGGLALEFLSPPTATEACEAPHLKRTDVPVWNPHRWIAPVTDEPRTAGRIAAPHVTPSAAPSAIPETIGDPWAQPPTHVPAIKPPIMPVHPPKLGGRPMMPHFDSPSPPGGSRKPTPPNEP